MSSTGKKQKTVAQKIGSVIASLLFMAAVILLALTAAAVIQFKGNPDEAFLLGYKPAIVQTGSMEPALRRNSVVIIRKTDFTRINPGDVLTYRQDGLFVTHRAISIEGSQVVVKGDANAVSDTYPVTAQNFVGTTVCRMNWMAPIIGEFEAAPLLAAARYLALPLVGVILLSFAVKMTIRFVRAGTPDRSGIETSSV